MNNKAAFVAWILFVTLLLFELMVVLEKLAFGETGLAVDNGVTVHCISEDAP